MGHPREGERRRLGANINKDCGEIATERDVQITDPCLSRGACVMVEGCSCGRCHILVWWVVDVQQRIILSKADFCTWEWGFTLNPFPPILFWHVHFLMHHKFDFLEFNYVSFLELSSNV